MQEQARVYYPSECLWSLSGVQVWSSALAVLNF